MNNFCSSQFYAPQMNTTNDALLPSIFVKIPLQINQQYQRNQNPEEIKCEEKSESIKSEVNESQNSGQNSEKNNHPPASTNYDRQELNVEYCEQTEVEHVTCFKCDECPFLTISQNKLNIHINNHHNGTQTTNNAESRIKINCPGCDNVFFGKKTLQVHLAEDHLMQQNETELVLDNLNNITTPSQSHQKNCPDKNKSRIYIKNVQLLKKHDVIEQENVEQRNNANKNKISIKNVHLLRNGFNSNENSFQNSSALHESKYSFIVPSPSPENLNSQSPPIVSDNSSTSTSQRSKIFIKNVDILRNPMFSVTPPSNSSSSDMNQCNEEIPYTPPPAPADSGTSTDSEMLIVPAAPVEKNKIFIKNISVLKQPTIHLKSVDELNLMTFDQLQNLLPLNNNEDNFSNQIDSNYSNNNSNDFTSLILNETENDNVNICASTDDAVYHHPCENVEYQNIQNCDFESEINIIAPETIENEYNNNFIVIEPYETNMLVISNHPEEAPQNLGTYTEQKCDEFQQYDEFLTACAEEILNQNRMYVCDDNITIQQESSHINKIEQMKIDTASKEEEKNKNRGRPKGAKQTGITRLKKIFSNVLPTEVGYKCDLVSDCGVRFKNVSLLEYHKKCHVIENNQTATIKCAECSSMEYKNWNTLHTHLWRDHKIDMELYSCDICSFKTPSLSRLNNEHTKIHSLERNFKCDNCDKAFKNTKQLRNHRRLHRQQDLQKQGNKADKPVLMKKCGCGQKFMNQRSLKVHIDSKHGSSAPSVDNVELKCELENCEKIFSTKSLLKTHVKMKHSDKKRFKCINCDYSTNDHNAFRRHKMRHNKNEHMYKCSYCDYTSIQSTTYRKHLEKRHADVASNLLYKCTKCQFISISEVKYELHKSKHETVTEIEDTTDTMLQQNVEDNTDENHDQDRLCESVSSDVVIVDPNEYFDTHTASTPTVHTVPNSQPIIRPAIFANNFSKVDNFMCYPTQFQPKILKLTDRIDATHIYSQNIQRYDNIQQSCNNNNS